jgi:hypothetical protein
MQFHRAMSIVLAAATVVRRDCNKLGISTSTAVPTSTSVNVQKYKARVLQTLSSNIGNFLSFQLSTWAIATLASHDGARSTSALQRGYQDTIFVVRLEAPARVYFPNGTETIR